MAVFLTTTEEKTSFWWHQVHKESLQALQTFAWDICIECSVASSVKIYSCKFSHMEE